MKTAIETCGPTCPLETVTLRALKDEESGRIRSDQTLAENIDNLAGAYARLAVRYDDIMATLERIDAKLDKLQRRVDKLSSLKWWIGIIVGGATVGGQIATAFLK